MTLQDRIPVSVFVLQQSEVSAVRYLHVHRLLELYRAADAAFVPIAYEDPQV